MEGRELCVRQPVFMGSQGILVFPFRISPSPSSLSFAASSSFSSLLSKPCARRRKGNPKGNLPPPSTINTRGVESVFFGIVVKKESTVCFLSVFPSLRGRRSREMSLRSLLAPQPTSIFFARGDGKRREEEEEEG